MRELEAQKAAELEEEKRRLEEAHRAETRGRWKAGGAAVQRGQIRRRCLLPQGDGLPTGNGRRLPAPSRLALEEGAMGRGAARFGGRRRLFPSQLQLQLQLQLFRARLCALQLLHALAHVWRGAAAVATPVSRLSLGDPRRCLGYIGAAQWSSRLRTRPSSCARA